MLFRVFFLPSTKHEHLIQELKRTKNGFKFVVSVGFWNAVIYVVV